MNTNYQSMNFSSRFKQNFNLEGDFNALGYGFKKPFAAPLFSPTDQVSLFYRRSLLLSIDSWYWIIAGVLQFFRSLITGDSWDYFWYNNAAASGTQLYPSGLSLFYDFFSMQGLLRFYEDFIFINFQNIFLTFLWIPYDVWMILLNG